VSTLEAHLQRQAEHSRGFFWHRVRWQAVAGELGGAEFTLTDVGAGIGLIGDLLAAGYPGARYRFVEPLASLAADLDARFGPDANAGDAASYADSAYVTLLDVLEHIEDDRAFLESLAGKMAPGATLIMTVPALQRLWSSWDVGLGHYRRYDKRQLRALFASLPFRVREISYLFPEMLAPALVRRARRRTDGGEATAEFPDLSPRVNDALYRIGLTTLRARRAWPAGTSLLLVADRS
jgi:hypothetical protein